MAASPIALTQSRGPKVAPIQSDGAHSRSSVQANHYKAVTSVQPVAREG